MPDSAPLRIDILGRVQACRGARAVDLGPNKQRGIFAVLALNAGEAVSTDALLEAVWAREMPFSSRHLVHTYIARLRQAFEPDVPPRRRVHVIASAGPGYRLAVEPDVVDVARFRQLWARARTLSAAGEWARALEMLGEAVRLWQDPSLGDLQRLLHSPDAIEALRKSWIEAALEYVTMGLKHERAAVTLSTAERLADLDPLDERIQARYLSVLERTGQRPAAIQHFVDVRARLHSELGIEPGPELASIYQALLRVERRPAAWLPIVRVRSPRTPWRGPGPCIGGLVARDTDLDGLLPILTRQRLVTVVGPPGCGKSAMALHAAERVRDRFSGGVAVVDISDVTDRAGLASAIVNVLDGFGGGDDLASILGDQQLLIVLDNAEHMVDLCAQVADELVRACRHVSVLVTSREQLSLPDETVWRLRSLAVPGPDGLAHTSAMDLFALRAAQVRPGFRIGSGNAREVAIICRSLDGLPLALELGAACLATDDLGTVVDKAADPLHLLRPQRRGRPVHHRSLCAALVRSVECLNTIERRFFVRLGSLPRHFDLPAVVRAVQPIPRDVDLRSVLARLVDKSLLSLHYAPSGPEYRMLRLIHRLAMELNAAEATPSPPIGFSTG